MKKTDTYTNEGLSWWQRRKQGYGINLYRNTRKRKLGGVCAGVADHFSVDHWVVRLAFIGGLFFFNMLMVWAYLGLWICLAARPKKGRVKQRYRYDENIHQDRPITMFRYELDAQQRLAKVRERLQAVNERVEKMEHYVTSKRYQLDKEFSKMEN